MGRVRKYKKIKAIDPFSNKKRSGIDVKHDDPLDLFDEKKKRNRKKLDRAFDDLEHAEKMLQREAVRQLRDVRSKNLHHKQGQNVAEGKRPDESMKDFQHRIRNETKITLRDELLKMTKTSQKKKEHMKAKKIKKKLQKQAVNGLIGGRTEEENDVINRDFNQRHDGLLRPSDLVHSNIFQSLITCPLSRSTARCLCHRLSSVIHSFSPSIPSYHFDLMPFCLVSHITIGCSILFSQN